MTSAMVGSAEGPAEVEGVENEGIRKVSQQSDLNSCLTGGVGGTREPCSNPSKVECRCHGGRRQGDGRESRSHGNLD